MHPERCYAGIAGGIDKRVIRLVKRITQLLKGLYQQVITHWGLGCHADIVVIQSFEIMGGTH